MSCVTRTVGNSYNFFGTVVGENKNKSWYVVFDFLPHDKKIVKHIYCNKLSAVKPYE